MRRAPHRRAAPRIAGGSPGFTLIEVMAAMLIAMVVIGALVFLFMNSNNGSLANQREMSQLSVLQQQIESVRQLVKQSGFGALALNGNPAQPADSTLPLSPTDPNDFITGWNTASEAFLVESNYNSTSACGSPPCVIAGTPSTGEPLIAPVTGVSGGLLAPVQYVDIASGTSYPSAAGVPSGDAYAIVNTYVTQASTTGCNASLGGSCAGDTRRVILAVRLSNPGARTNIGVNTPTYSTTIFANPIPSNQPNSAGGLRILGLIP
jgi:type II secretory pathway pseudopilin PulG